jgi:hypothetical protein
MVWRPGCKDAGWRTRCKDAGCCYCRSSDPCGMEIPSPEALTRERFGYAMDCAKDNSGRYVLEHWNGTDWEEVKEDE